MKQYPLELNNVGSDEYILMSKGHQDKVEFMKLVKEEYPEWPMGEPQHLWAKATPCNTGEYTCYYNFVDKSVRGSFPVTYSHEDYGHEFVSRA